LKIAYEDVRLAPKSTLLQELDAVENAEYIGTETHDPKFSTPTGDQDSSYHQVDKEIMPNNKSPTYLVSPSSELPLKDVGTISSTPGPSPSETLDIHATEQSIILQIQAAIGDSDVSASQLKWVPQWLLDKAVKGEQTNYLTACSPVHFRDIPAQSNVISSHLFFSIKHSSDGHLKLKCRMVPHGNRDLEKDGLRTDSATAQFGTIRLLLSLAVLLKLRVSSIDISGAYLQAEPLTRDIFVRHPPGWAPSGIVWKMLRPAYGLVESGRLWQLAIESWLADYEFTKIPGLSLMFIFPTTTGRITLILAKVVDDLLVAGSINSKNKFHCDLSSRFKVCRFFCNRQFVVSKYWLSNWAVKMLPGTRRFGYILLRGLLILVMLCLGHFFPPGFSPSSTDTVS
jgi:Reverse transcriptase (RNA-dependent DNA polymerase)